MDKDQIVLSYGLDLRSPKLLAQPGAIVDCLNREVVDSIGLKRIDGFEPYDGRLSPAQQEYFVITASGYSGNVSSTYTNNTLLVISGSTNIFGKVVATNNTNKTITYVLINRDYEPAVGDTVTPLGGGTAFVITARSVGTTADADPDTSVANLNTYASVLRGAITSLHSTPIGLHWYRDRAYAVVNDRVGYFTSGGTTEIEPNYFIKGNTSNAVAKVLAVQLDSGTWAGGNAAGSIQYALLTSNDFSGTETFSYSNDSTFASSISADVATRAASGTSALDFASLWQSRSELQAQAESASAGWSHLEHGWAFDYEDGLSDTGAFTTITKSSTNNFTFDSDNEYQDPVTWLNGMNVTGLKFAPLSPPFVLTSEQVELGNGGWKTSASSTAYASSTELQTALTADDVSYAYANIFYQANGSLGSSGFPPGKLVARDKSIYGPTTSALSGVLQPASVGTESFDSDFMTCQARAPLVLKDFSGVASTIPVGSLIVGIEVTVSYSSQHYSYGEFQADRVGTDGADIVESVVTWLKDAFSWNACLVQTSSDTAGAMLGTEQAAPIVIESVPANYQSSVVAGTYADSYRLAATKTGQTATIGGNGNIFGATNLTRTSLLNPNLAIALVGQVTAASEFAVVSGGVAGASGMVNYPSGGSTTFSEGAYGTVRLKVDRIRVRFYYTTPSARYYARESNTEVASVDLVFYVNKDGSLTSGTGEGEWQVTNVTAAEGTKRFVKAGDTLHLTEADAIANANAIATVTSDMEYRGFPGLTSLNEENSRYQFITANFYGVDDWDGFYGVSGAGRAFSFSSYDAGAGVTPYIINISTNTEDEPGDKPRHIAYHHGSLALGFSSGVVRFSVSGLPENFSGEDGAAEIGVGDKITGMLSMVGTTLAVFCENSIHALNGTDPQAIDPQILAPKTGAVEYTVVDMGIPVFCNSAGISTLDQTQKYGNFSGRRLSYAVTPWILRRVITSDSILSTANGLGIVCAIPVRAKNQYLLFFKDGYVLCMTMNADSNPAFTYRRYILNDNNDAFLVPIAWSSEVDNNGVERVLMSHYSNISEASTNYVYQLDKGWGFAGQFIPAYYVVNWHYKDPFTEMNLRKVRLDGLTLGVSSNNIYTSNDYNTTFDPQAVDISMTEETPLPQLYQDYWPATKLAHVGARGRSIGMKIEDVGTASNPIPPDIHQVLLLQYPVGGKNDG